MNFFAVWACGAAGTGKSCISEAAILPLGFELIDVDQSYESLLKKYKLSMDDILEDSENGEVTKTLQYARRTAERLSHEGEANGQVDPQKFIASLNRAVRDGKLRDDNARQLIALLQTKTITMPLPFDSFRKAIFPLMSDWDDPLDYLEDKKPVTREHILAVAREVTKRRLIKARRDKKNLLLVETGGQTGRLINLKNALESESYHTYLLWFYLENPGDILRRNEVRRTSGGRSLDKEILNRSIQVAQRVREQLLMEFQPHAAEINNSRDGEEYIRSKIADVHLLIRKWMAR